MKVQDIYVYPVKSLRGIKVTESRIEQYGFRYDRVYMLAKRTADPNTMEFFTQRTEPRLVKVTTSIKDDSIVLQHEELGIELRLPADQSQLPKDLRVVDVDVWGANVVSYDVGPIIPGFTEFWTKVLGPGLPDLTILAPKKARALDTERFDVKIVEKMGWTPETSFQDGSPGNLVCTASLESLQLRINSQNEEVQISAENFRPNLVIESEDPFEEDDWAKIKIGEYIWHVPMLCRRCQMPTVNIERGEFEKSKQPNRALNQFRKIDGHHPSDPCFGMEIYPEKFGQVIRVGDAVEVLELMDRPMPGDV